MGLEPRNTLANANATRDWRIYADFAQRLIGIARGLYIDELVGVELANTAYPLDATTVDLSLSLFPWAPFRSTKAAVKLPALLDLRRNIPSFIHISDVKLHDVNILDQLIAEAGAFYDDLNSWPQCVTVRTHRSLGDSSALCHFLCLLKRKLPDKWG